MATVIAWTARIATVFIVRSYIRQVALVCTHDKYVTRWTQPTLHAKRDLDWAGQPFLQASWSLPTQSHKERPRYVYCHL